MGHVDGNTPSILKHDGVEKFRGTYNECLMKLHRLQGQSWDYATKWGGWTIEPIKEIGTGTYPLEHTDF